MEFFKQTNIDFLGLKKWTTILSIVLFTGSIVALLVNGLHFGLDFTGGTQIQVSYPQTAGIGPIRTAMRKAGFEQSSAVRYGAGSVLIRIGNGHHLKQQQLTNQVMGALPSSAKLQQVEFIGPQVGHELATNGALALLVALILTTVYIALRFEYRFAVSSAVALIHDPVLILGVFALFKIEFDLTALTAVLTVIGYSLNDTIVVFDRVRENFLKMRRVSAEDVVNLSVNQTLSRTIMTSGLTLVAVLALYFFGGPAVHAFSLALIIGIVIGTYSSIYVAGALAVVIGLDRKDFLPQEKAVLDDRP